MPNNLIENLIHTKDQELLGKYSNSPILSIREAIAINPNTPSKILKKLAYDPTVNVAIKAINNKRCFERREFLKEDLENVCIVCNKSPLVKCKEYPYCKKQ